ncbi:MAG TPA: hypothetical protein P5572_22120 [Phycisphaerae bacterium]|nr:hypothetical protein [Phycisphaerales bacterium]HRX87733.1 hypothetical protein [Phycisphaerae bacterium]
MPVNIMCPNLACRSVLRVPDNVRGKRIRCGECGTVFTVPEQPKAPASKNAAPKTPAKGSN